MRLSEIKGEKVHSRDICISTFKAGEDQVIVEGVLHDKRLIETRHMSGETRPADTVHHMIVRWLVDKSLTIKQVEVELKRFPHQECPETESTLQKLEGMKVAKGFTMKVKDLFGKGIGCSHLTELVIAMAPATIQGFWTAHSGKPVSKKMAGSMKPMLENTCYVWRKNGPAIKKLEEKIASQA